MRLRNSTGEMVEDLIELGFTMEEAAMSATRLQQQLLDLTDGRVDIMYTADNLKTVRYKPA